SSSWARGWSSWAGCFRSGGRRGWGDRACALLHYRRSGMVNDDVSAGVRMNSQSPIQESVPARLARVREVMAREGVDALLVPSADPHLSEYLPGHWQGRQWLSGFHGSVGTLVVMARFAGL